MLRSTNIFTLAIASRLVSTSLEHGKITGADVLKIFQSLTTKAVGDDGLCLDMLTPIWDLVAPILDHILNFSRTSSVFPTEWKSVHVIPLP